MEFNWQAIIKYFPELLSGIPLTLTLVVISGVLGLLFGLILALMRLSSNKLLNFLSFIYIFFFRGTPLLVQLFLIYYGLSQFDFVIESFLWEPILKHKLWCAIIAFTLNTSAYVAEIIRGAIQSIPEGELEAADAIGMSRIQKLTRITLPRAFGIMLPAYSNEVIFMLKGSSLAMTIALMEVTGIAKTIGSKTYAVLEMYFAAGIIYLVLTWVIILIFRLLEKHMNRHNNYVPPDMHAPPDVMIPPTVP